MSIINISNLTFGYDENEKNIFENVSLNLDTDWRLGFVGRNGRGKTTFLNLLMGQYSYKGNIACDLEFEYFPFEISNVNQKTVDVINSFDYQYNLWELEREMSLLDIPDETLHQEFSTLSKGEQTKIMLAFLFLKEDKFLLIDEPTNHLDANGREKVANYLKSKKGFILVSHDRYFLDACVNHILSINKNNIEIQRGNFFSWKLNKDREDSFEIEKNAKLKKDIKRLEVAAKKTALWSNKIEDKKSKKSYGSKVPPMIDKGFVGAKAAKMMKKSKNLESRQNNAIEEKSSLLKNIENASSLKLHLEKYHSKDLLTLDNVSIYYDEKEICKNISFTVERGDRVALVGKNGSGKSSILKLIMGENLKTTGNFTKGTQMKISYVSQDTGFLKGNLSDFIIENAIDETLFKTILRKLDFSREHFSMKMENYSQGQKKKVLLAKSLSEKAHLYIWDEPLNFIDIYSRIQLEEVLLAFVPTIIFVEHDKIFMENITNKIVDL